MLDWEERRLMVKIARLYYFDGWTQAEIARKHNVSRPLISKILGNARKEGIVDIYIKDETALTVELEEKLEEKYKLKEVIVVSAMNLTDQMVKRQIGRTAASYVSKNLDGIKNIAISWGSTILAFVEEYPYERRNDIHVVPIIGGMGYDHVHLHSNQLAYQLSQKMGANCSYLYAPAMVENIELKEKLIHSKEIAHVLESGRNVDMAIVGIGSPFKNSTLVKMGYLEEDDLKSLRRAGAVGNIGSSFFNVEGKEIDHPINESFIGLTIDEIKKIPKVIGIAEGPHKLESIEAALKGGLLDVFITDEQTAQSLID